MSSRMKSMLILCAIKCWDLRIWTMPKKLGKKSSNKPNSFDLSE